MIRLSSFALSKEADGAELFHNIPPYPESTHHIRQMVFMALQTIASFVTNHRFASKRPRLVIMCLRGHCYTITKFVSCQYL